MYDKDRKVGQTRIGIIVILKIFKVKHVIKTIYIGNDFCRLRLHIVTIIQVQEEVARVHEVASPVYQQTQDDTGREREAGRCI